MAIADSFTLPGQPALGSSVYTPLGGNGFSAPHSMYDITFQIVGDATGGNIVLAVVYDSRFTGMINWVCVTANSAAGDLGCVNVISTAEPSGQGFQDAAPMLQASGLALGTTKLWQPPPVAFTSTPTFDPTITTTFANSNLKEFNLTMQIYNFAKRAREKTPMYQLAANLPR
jgi:hypothetical protein